MRRAPSTYKTPDDEVMEDIQRQFHISDSFKDKNMDEMTFEEWDTVITPQHKESVRKLREILDI